MQMQIQLSNETAARIQDILEQLSIRYDLEDLSPEELIDALLQVGFDLIVADEATMPLGRARLIEYCGREVEAR